MTGHLRTLTRASFTGFFESELMPPGLPQVRLAIFAFVLAWWTWPFVLLNPESVAMLPWSPIIAAIIVLALTRGWAGVRDLLASLLHMHHNRFLGMDREREARVLAIARGVVEAHRNRLRFADRTCATNNGPFPGESVLQSQ